MDIQADGDPTRFGGPLLAASMAPGPPPVITE
jgi:hypothetical protein